MERGEGGRRKKEREKGKRNRWMGRGKEGGGEGMNQPRGQREDGSVWGSLTV